jgi:hypothetical protein
MQIHEQMLSTDPDRLLLDARTQRRCVEACFQAEVACIVCADACLAEQNVNDLTRCIRVNLDGADVAAATARMLARRLSDARLLRAQVETCARALSSCAAECLRHAEWHAHCRTCADACHRAAEECGSVLRELPDAHGQIHPKAPFSG